MFCYCALAEVSRKLTCSCDSSRLPVWTTWISDFSAACKREHCQVRLNFACKCRQWPWLCFESTKSTSPLQEWWCYRDFLTWHKTAAVPFLPLFHRVVLSHNSMASRQVAISASNKSLVQVEGSEQLLQRFNPKVHALGRTPLFHFSAVYSSSKWRHSQSHCPWTNSIWMPAHIETSRLQQCEDANSLHTSALWNVSAFCVLFVRVSAVMLSSRDKNQVVCPVLPVKLLSLG